MSTFNLKNATLSIVDGSGTPKVCHIKFGDGTLTFEEQKTREYLMDRGVVDEVRDGDDVPMNVSFDGRWQYISSASGATAPTPVEALKKTGPAASWVSTDADDCQPYCVDLILEYDPGACGTEPVETITLPKFRYESLNFDAKNATIAVRGRCNATEAEIARA